MHACAHPPVPAAPASRAVARTVAPRSPRAVFLLRRHRVVAGLCAALAATWAGAAAFDPAAGLPAWLELRWSDTVAVREVGLIFDTGLHRFLTLSQADGYTRRMHWGAPQPETVRAYRLEVETAAEPGIWTPVHTESDNYRRRRVHRLVAPEAPALSGIRALRIVVTATHGLDHARICEVRVYSECSD